MATEAISERSRASEFLEGVRMGMPVVIASAPFALLFGAVAVDNGFTVAEVVIMSAAIFGGASQMVGIELFGQAVAPWLVVLSILAVNFRHVLYSGGLGRRIRSWPTARQALGFFLLIDPQYAESEARGERGHAVTLGGTWEWRCRSMSCGSPKPGPAPLSAGSSRTRALGIDLRLSTDDGSAGQHGFVTDILRQLLDEPATGSRKIVCCGPERMMEAVAEIAKQYRVPCEVSLETPMACGIGICFTCVAKVTQPDGSWDYKRTCVEGPVFDAEKIVW